jgi:hypothetical protein
VETTPPADSSEHSTDSQASRSIEAPFHPPISSSSVSSPRASLGRESSRSGHGREYATGVQQQPGEVLRVKVLMGLICNEVRSFFD